MLIYREYDFGGKLHTSLFLSSYSDKVMHAYEMIRNVPIPRKVDAREFIICVSESSDSALLILLRA